MGSRLMCPTPRRPRRVLSTSGRRHWRLPTRKASRSARKASGLTQLGGGVYSPPLFFGAEIVVQDSFLPLPGCWPSPASTGESLQKARFLGLPGGRRRRAFVE